MKAKTKNTDRIRSLVRWSTGSAVTASIITGSCILFPSLVGSIAALTLTSALSIFIGLKVALPPINPEDDWVPIHARMDEVHKAAVKPSAMAEVVPLKVKPASGKPAAAVSVLPVHARSAIPRVSQNARPRRHQAIPETMDHSVWQRLHKLGTHGHRLAHILHKN